VIRRRGKATQRGRARRRSAPSLRVRSIKAALDEFLRAASGDNGHTNGELVVKHLGAKGIDLVDPPSFDAVALRYERPIKTFREAFRASWNGSRDWRRFDLAALRACDDLGALQLPERVEAALQAEQYDAAREDAEERAAIQAESRGEYTEAEADFPPLELLRRPGPSRRRRARRRRHQIKVRAKKRRRLVSKRKRPSRYRARRRGRKRRRLSMRAALKRAFKAAGEIRRMTTELLRDAKKEK
jgi:hypothetical protein